MSSTTWKDALIWHIAAMKQREDAFQGEIDERQAKLSATRNERVALEATVSKTENGLKPVEENTTP